VYEYSLNVSNVLRHIEHDINSAKEYIWLIADQSVIAGPSIDQAIGNRDVCVSIIIPKSSLTPEEYQQIKRLLRDKLEMKLVPDENVKIGIAMTEVITKPVVLRSALWILNPKTKKQATKKKEII
jgi:phosphatidylserine/phosphatidylglycerophosphate/cardiolipin synthase-like enzyme